MTSLAHVGRMFYLVSPNATTFEDPKDVPKYVNEAATTFVIFLLLELAFRVYQGKPARLNDAVTSLSLGIMHEATLFLSETFVLVGYEWLYQFRLFDFAWDSAASWWISLIVVDFIYYWVHRANHEINILWAAHQVHHSSEDYTLPTGLRLSMFQRIAYLGFYQPLALIGLPMTSVMVHLGLNYLFQFWVHNEAVRKMGPLEWIFNTPSHHRVHHGANKWCLDKNYGSLLIIWDRIFGTFEEERTDEKIAYGLVEQPQSLNSVWHEVFYLHKIYKKAKSMDTWGDSFKAVFYGPGWSPGSPRLGDPDTFPDVKAPRAKYDPQMSTWFMAYVVVHFTLAFMAQQLLLVHLKVSPWTTIVTFLTFIFLTFGTISSMFDSWRWAPMLEAARCSAYLFYARNTPITSTPMVDVALYVVFAMSAIFWTLESLKTFRHLKISKLQ